MQADSLPTQPPGKPKNIGMGSLSLLQGIFLTQELNWGLLRCRQILYQLSHKGTQEYWSGYRIPAPGDLPDPGIEPRSPALQAESLSAELPYVPRPRFERPRGGAGADVPAAPGSSLRSRLAQGLYLDPFCRGGNQGSGRLSALPTTRRSPELSSALLEGRGGPGRCT